MNIRNEYIEKTKEYLKLLRTKKFRKNMLEKEIAILKRRQSIDDGIDLSKLGFKSRPADKGIDDLIISCDTKICMREAEIDQIIEDEFMYSLYSSDLDQETQDIIKIRYFDKNENKYSNLNSFSFIAKKIGYSPSSVIRKHDEAIEELAYYIHGEDSVY